MSNVLKQHPDAAAKVVALVRCKGVSVQHAIRRVVGEHGSLDHAEWASMLKMVDYNIEHARMQIGIFSEIFVTGFFTPQDYAKFLHEYERHEIRNSIDKAINWLESVRKLL